MNELIKPTINLLHEVLGLDFFRYFPMRIKWSKFVMGKKFETGDKFL